MMNKNDIANYIKKPNVYYLESFYLPKQVITFDGKNLYLSQKKKNSLYQLFEYKNGNLYNAYYGKNIHLDGKTKFFFDGNYLVNERKVITIVKIENSFKLVLESQNFKNFFQNWILIPPSEMDYRRHQIDHNGQKYYLKSIYFQTFLRDHSNFYLSLSKMGNNNSKEFEFFFKNGLLTNVSNMKNVVYDTKERCICLSNNQNNMKNVWFFNGENFCLWSDQTIRIGFMSKGKVYQGFTIFPVPRTGNDNNNVENTKKIDNNSNVNQLEIIDKKLDEMKLNVEETGEILTFQEINTIEKNIEETKKILKQMNIKNQNIDNKIKFIREELLKIKISNDVKKGKLTKLYEDAITNVYLPSGNLTKKDKLRVNEISMKYQIKLDDLGVLNDELRALRKNILKYLQSIQKQLDHLK